MDISHLLNLRLANQQLIRHRFSTPEALLQYMGPLQAQEYEHALWAIGMRLKHADRQVVEASLEERKLIRTWLMRGTIHIAHAEHVYAILALVGERLIRRKAARYRQLELDEQTLAQAMEVLSTALEGGKELDRKELGKKLEQVDINIAGQRLYHILHHAGLLGLICFGKRKGKTPTYILLKALVPDAQRLDPEAAIIRLARQFFNSRGPARLADFVWWSGLPKMMASRALEEIKADLVEFFWEDESYWGSPYTHPLEGNFLHALPAFDEFVIAYPNRAMILHENQQAKDISQNGVFYPLLLQHGQLIAKWKAKQLSKKVRIELEPLADLPDLKNVFEDYGQFLGKEIELLS